MYFIQKGVFKKASAHTLYGGKADEKFSDAQPEHLMVIGMIILIFTGICNKFIDRGTLPIRTILHLLNHDVATLK